MGSVAPPEDPRRSGIRAPRIQSPGEPGIQNLTSPPRRGVPTTSCKLTITLRWLWSALAHAARCCTWPLANLTCVRRPGNRSARRVHRQPPRTSRTPDNHDIGDPDILHNYVPTDYPSLVPDTHPVRTTWWHRDAGATCPPHDMHNPVVRTTSRNNHVHGNPTGLTTRTETRLLTTFYPPGKTHPKKGHFDPPAGRGVKHPPKRGGPTPPFGGWRYTKQCKFWRDSSVLIQGVRRFLRLRRVFFDPFFGSKNDPQNGGVSTPLRMALLTYLAENLKNDQKTPPGRTG